MHLFTRLMKRFRDREYRRTYMDGFTDAYLATQLKVLREQRGLTQTQLAELVGVKQSQICRWESVNNTSWQVRTLKRIAAALDLVLVVRLESFGRMLPDVATFGRPALQRWSFAEDPVFRRDQGTTQHFAATVALDSDCGPCTPDAPAEFPVRVPHVIPAGSQFSLEDDRRVS